MPRQKPWYLPTAEANFECCSSNIYNNSDYDHNSNDFIIKSIKIAKSKFFYYLACHRKEWASSIQILLSTKIKMANQRFLTA